MNSVGLVENYSERAELVMNGTRLAENHSEKKLN
jgi:hypothetical protein